ncbi:MAG: N-acetylmuramic acid 6-phosphate etherase [Candidatus Latescibacteria bacterium]|nr:N-acetylmuramic acid 6-phosphate etherase [Candidatus Latescibacterota bacterium]NIM22223.1 N-acetylmuramic acid 6-phosphate etherase [Candidatus Latescibacterota bacterium]NIM66262.1 N-acetylmuramic acid 6-phosphate etherase [Candidatus Latescibacterota bacterium]NIO02339.1 N-acetylmuramic acid 6-phosphate etherase [Candidatus Latescibacterota bacterium]NIO29870.1 N-acetylmuramic acid 6-phosphate etherase [Candidatus Latescibacterota bacterium]
MPEERENLFDLLQDLTTERRNPRTKAIDLASTRRILELMSAEDRTVAEAVGRVIPMIARAVDLVVESFKHGGRLLYAGAGTSGRLGVIDAAECPPTFGVDPGMVVGMIAGGRDTVFLSREGIEDDKPGGMRDVEAHDVLEKDTVMGITASRRTPYVLGALEEAKRRKAKTIFLCCNEGAQIDVDVKICVVVGPEAIAGSTRLKAATAQKMILNMVTTASMVKLGKVYENLMVDLKPASEKLVERAKGIIMMLTGAEYERASEVFAASGRNVKVAVVMQKLGLGRKEAESALKKADGFLARALGER